MSPTPQNIQDLNEYLPPKDLLKDKLVVVTGTTSGIGKAMSLSCATHGARSGPQKSDSAIRWNPA